MTDLASPLTIPARFRGPASSGNGGWTAGALAGYLAPGPVRVMLRIPPPLDTPLAVAIDGDSAAASLLDRVVAVAAPADADVVPVPMVPVEEARAAQERYVGRDDHPFPTCYSCGTGRAPGDGLRIFPGRVADDDEGRARVAATWTPDVSQGDDRAEDAGVGTASFATTWAALDCVGGWAGDLGERLMVLGAMTADVRDLPRVGEEHVVVGGGRGSDGRKTFTAASLYTADGRLLGTAEHVWFAVDPADFA